MLHCGTVVTSSITTRDTEAIRAGVGLGSGTEVNTHQSLQYAMAKISQPMPATW